jgi:siroheme synthase (precorrin-2 oxidase/ferrochelatase)
MLTDEDMNRFEALFDKKLAEMEERLREAMKSQNETMDRIESMWSYIEEYQRGIQRRMDDFEERLAKLERSKGRNN